MASHELYGHHPIQAQSQQPGLEFDNSERRDFSDKQTITTTSQSFYKREIDGVDNRDDTGQRRSRNPFGLSPLTFGLLVALITAVVIGGAVGGGVGSQLNSCSSKSSPISTIAVSGGAAAATASASSTPSSTATYMNYIAPRPSQILSVPLDCPALNSQNYTTLIGDQFTFACGIDYSGNDLSALIAYHVEDCCTACSAYNFQQRSSGLNQSCQAFTFNANMTFAYLNENPAGGNNCWLKSKAGPGVNVGSSLRVVGGKLV